MFNWIKSFKLDFRVVGLIFMLWGVYIFLEGLLAFNGLHNNTTALIFLIRCIFPLIIGVFLYLRGDDVIIRQDK